MSDDAAHQVTVAGAYQWFSNIAIKSACTTAGGAVSTTVGNLRFVSCRITNSANNSAARALTAATAASVSLVGCRFQTHAAGGRVLSLGIGTSLQGCHLSSGVIGIYSDGGFDADSCVIEGSSTSGVQMAAASGSFILTHCTIYTAGTNGINVSTIPTSGRVMVSNCIIGGCTNGITAASATSGVTVLRTHFYSCTNNLVNLQEVAAFDDPLGILLRLIDNDTDPFVAKASSDYTLAAANTIDRATGFPGTIEGQTAMVGYPDIGAIHHAGPAAANVRATDYTASGAAGSIATQTLSNTTTTVAAGYYAADDLATRDTDLAAANIVSGKTIFGVAGAAAGGAGGLLTHPGMAGGMRG